MTKVKRHKQDMPNDPSALAEDRVATEGAADAGADIPEDAAANMPVSELLDRLAKAEAAREEYLDLAQRVQADFDNFRRRNQSVRAEAVADGANEVLTQLLPVVDNLERALDATTQAATQGVIHEEQASQLHDGVGKVLKQLVDTMGKFGVTEINRLGEAFDPNLENAVMQGTAEEGEPGTVCEVFQKGYKTSSKVLRHAMVKVVMG